MPRHLIEILDSVDSVLQSPGIAKDGGSERPFCPWGWEKEAVQAAALARYTPKGNPLIT